MNNRLENLRKKRIELEEEAKYKKEIKEEERKIRDLKYPFINWLVSGSLNFLVGAGKFFEKATRPPSKSGKPQQKQSQSRQDYKKEIDKVIFGNK